MRVLGALTAIILLIPGSVLAQGAADGLDLDPVDLAEVDLGKAVLADAKRQIFDEAVHFAVPIDVSFSHLDEDEEEDGEKDGQWDRSPLGEDEFRWRLRLRSQGALSLSLAFKPYRMPEGAELLVYSADGEERIGPFTHRDNEEHGELWTPPLMTDDLVVELRGTIDIVDDADLRLVRVHHGYAGFGEEQPLSGSCQRDVACFDNPIWHDVARSVALISIDGVRFCSGFMVNNTQLDGRPFFLTAHHCGVTEENAASVVVMWNYESTTCRATDDLESEALRRPSRNFQTGALLRAAYEPTDVALLELDDLPDGGWNVHYAGWDRSDTEPEGVTVIHHPNTDLKRLSFDHGLAKATFFRYDRGSSSGDHLRVGAWEQGSTEGGSSGSPLFNQNQRVIGQLHGGYAQCGEKEADWFGRFSVSWIGSGKAGSRLSDWLDPLGTETLDLDGLDARLLIDTVDP